MNTSSFAALLIASFFIAMTLVRALKRVPEGYEDESGFHFGRIPQVEPTDAAAPESYDLFEEIPAEEIAAGIES